MCLELISDKLIAKEDIICYKVVIKKDDKLYTPYVNVEIEPGIFKASGSIYKDLEGNISKGVIHTYGIYNQALWERRVWDNSLIYKCIIPKGTSYYIGLFEANLSYGSKVIEVLEQCNGDTDKKRPVNKDTIYFGDIQSYEDALKYLEKDAIPETGDKSVDAFIKLKTIAEAWNKIDRFKIVNGDVDSLPKHYPCFHKDLDSVYVRCSNSNISTCGISVGGQIYFRTLYISHLFGKMFADLYTEYLMLDS